MGSAPEEAGAHFKEGVRLFFEDGRLGLTYILLRLEHELTDHDRRNLRDLIACACEDKDVNESADRVRKAPSASQLAVAIADIVQNANSHKKAAALGAIFGAHGTPFGSSKQKFIEAAVAGAVAASSAALLDDGKIGIGLHEFLVRDT
jgi:hypothetical protein